MYNLQQIYIYIIYKSYVWKKIIKISQTVTKKAKTSHFNDVYLQLQKINKYIFFYSVHCKKKKFK